MTSGERCGVVKFRSTEALPARSMLLTTKQDAARMANDDNNTPEKSLTIISRAEAKALGLPRFFIGVPCKNGHVVERKVTNYHCVECLKPSQKRSRKRNPATYKAIVRRHELKRNYGITPEQWNAIFELQGKRCAICLTNSSRLWNTDHCHVTNKVRGILCDSCNNGLGRFKDNPDSMRRAADYLEKYK